MGFVLFPTIKLTIYILRGIRWRLSMCIDQYNRKKGHQFFFKLTEWRPAIFSKINKAACKGRGNRVPVGFTNGW